MFPDLSPFYFRVPTLVDGLHFYFSRNMHPSSRSDRIYSLPVVLVVGLVTRYGLNLSGTDSFLVILCFGMAVARFCSTLSFHTVVLVWFLGH